jgi:hypothetical protein
MENLKPNDKRAKNAIILIWIMLALDIISFISGYFQYNLLESASKGIEISIETANANDLREQIIGITNLIVFFISAITFILWFRRAYYNLHLKSSFLTYKEEWAVYAWFLPFINLYRPFKIMKELYHETKRLLSRQGYGLDIKASSFTLGIWWTLWLTNNFIGQFILRYSQESDTVDQIITTTIASMVGNIVGVFLSLITIKVISDYSKLEENLHKAEDIESIGTTE